MALTTTQLIQAAFKNIGVLSNDRNLSNDEIAEGLEQLNFLLTHFSAEPQLIAYRKVLEFPLVANQITYEISQEPSADVTSNRLVILNYINLRDSQIQYPVQIVPDAYYYNRRRVVNYIRRPTQVFLQNDIGKSFLTFLAAPDKSYDCTIKGKFVLDEVTLNTDFTEVPRYYYAFLELALARALNGKYPGSRWTPVQESEYESTRQSVMSVNDRDLLPETSKALNFNYYYYYDILNG